MGYVPPPNPPPYDVLMKRIQNGARTMKELDPAFYQWCSMNERFAKFQIVGACICAACFFVILICLLIRHR